MGSGGRGGSVSRAAAGVGAGFVDYADERAARGLEFMGEASRIAAGETLTLAGEDGTTVAQRLVRVRKLISQANMAGEAANRVDENLFPTNQHPGRKLRDKIRTLTDQMFNRVGRVQATLNSANQRGVPPQIAMRSFGAQTVARELDGMVTRLGRMLRPGGAAQKLLTRRRTQIARSRTLRRG